MAEMDSETTNGGGDTAMFRAFVNSADNYQEKSGSKGPLVVAGVALAIAVLAFVIIVALS